MKLLQIFTIILLSTFFIACESDGATSFSDTQPSSTIYLGDLETTLDDNSPPGAYIGQIEVLNDSVDPINEIVLYGISAEYFKIDLDGKITLSAQAQLNQLIKENYTLEAIAINLTQESNRGIIKINLKGSEVPRLKNTSINIDENTSAGSVIGSVDILSNTRLPITEIILNGNGSSDFNIDINGTVTLSDTASLDYDIKNLYTLQVTASNSNGSGLPSDLIITLNNTNVQDTNSTGLPLVLIAVSFNDYVIEDSEINWNKKIFGTSFGEINHYFREVLQSKFSLSEANETSATSNDGIIKVTLNSNHPGNNNMDHSYLNEAITLADPFIDFSVYDKNANLNIEVDELQIMFIIGGGETAYGDPDRSSVWAHVSGFSSDNISPPVVDGVKIMDINSSGKYTIFGEKHSNHFATVGIIAHELSHAIWGLPDLYDRDYSSSGIGSFGLMASGSWSAKAGESPGTTPSQMCAWSKISTQLIVAEEVSETSSGLAVKANHTTSSNILKVSTVNPNEYFLVENRSPAGYDSGLYRMQDSGFTGGLAIWHIDDGQRESQNDDESHKLVDLEEANTPELDDSSNSLGKITNLFYAQNSNAFNPITTPNSNDYNASDTNITMGGISDVGSIENEYIMYIDIRK